LFTRCNLLTDSLVRALSSAEGSLELKMLARKLRIEHAFLLSHEDVKFILDS